MVDEILTADPSEIENEVEIVADIWVENRNFSKIKLGDVEYKARFDPGATLSLVNTDVAGKLKDRLEGVETMVDQLWAQLIGAQAN